MQARGDAYSTIAEIAKEDPCFLVKVASATLKDEVWHCKEFKDFDEDGFSHELEVKEQQLKILERAEHLLEQIEKRAKREILLVGRRF